MKPNAVRETMAGCTKRLHDVEETPQKQKCLLNSNGALHSSMKNQTNPMVNDIKFCSNPIN